jgi:hypothetical protein
VAGHDCLFLVQRVKQTNDIADEVKLRVGASVGRAVGLAEAALIWCNGVASGGDATFPASRN